MIFQRRSPYNKADTITNGFTSPNGTFRFRQQEQQRQRCHRLGNIIYWISLSLLISMVYYYHHQQGGILSKIIVNNNTINNNNNMFHDNETVERSVLKDTRQSKYPNEVHHSHEGNDDHDNKHFDDNNNNTVHDEENSNDNQEASLHYEQPIILEEKKTFPHLALVFDGGCSGSTAVGRFLEEIIIGHGLQRFDKGGFEFLNIHSPKGKEKNPFYFNTTDIDAYKGKEEEDLLIESVKKAGVEANDSGKLFYFKAGHNHINYTRPYRKAFDEFGVNFIGVYRENVLDRCICTTNDCFTEKAGYPVFKDSGIKTSLCFSRRKAKATVVTNFTDPVSCFQESMNKQMAIKRADFPSVSVESLFAFEYSDDDDTWEFSIEAWMTILKPFLLDSLNKSLLQESLKKYRGSRQALKPHRELVYNFDHLKNQIENTEWEMYLRK